MKLSEAVRLGSAGKTQIQDKFFGAPGECCALGAALLAVYGNVPAARAARHDYGSSLALQLKNVLTDCRQTSQVVTKNDDGKSFEEIIAFLEARGW